MDTDGDGLTDSFELDYQQKGIANGGGPIDATDSDSDDDGLCDFQEIRLGTMPGMADTDGDGLTDAEEVYHAVYNCATHTPTGAWSGGWDFQYAPGKTLHISSDPLLRDADGDGMSDKLEKMFHELDPEDYPYHPSVWNPNPLALYMAISDRDDFVAPGDSLVYTATVANELTVPWYESGAITTTFPAALGGSAPVTPFELFQHKQLEIASQVTASGSTQLVSIGNLARAQLLDSAAGPPLNDDRLSTSGTYSLTVDADQPSSTIQLSAYTRAGGYLIIGGSASDPTSYISRVEISADQGASYETTLCNGVPCAETWAYTWARPGVEGRHTLYTRAVDAVGNVEDPPHSYTVIVDGQPPNLPPTMPGNPIQRSRQNNDLHWTVELYGTVADPPVGADPGSGVQQVEVNVEPLSTGWQTATLTLAPDGRSGDWHIYYPLAKLDAGNGNDAVADPTGQYTVTVRATDSTGNVTQPANYRLFQVRLDNLAPEVSLDPIHTEARVISATLTVVTSTDIISTAMTLTGAMTEPQGIATGLDSLEIAFVPADMLGTLSAPSLLMFMNELPGNADFRDLSGNDAPITCDPLAGTCPQTGLEGMYGLAAGFDGADDRLDIRADVPESDVTWALWFRTTCDDCGLVSAYNAASHDRDLFLSGGHICAMVFNGYAETICSRSGTDYADGAWHHVVHTLGPDGSRLYVDGIEESAGWLTASGLAQTGLFLGYASNAVQPYFSGRVDEFEIYNKAFNIGQVAALYRRWQPAALADSGPNVASTTWSYRLDEPLEGYYQIDMRGADVIGNRNDEHRGRWPQWNGLIDLAPPQVSLEVSYSGAGSSAQTHYAGSATDFDLTTDQFAFPCPLEASDYGYYSSPWWDRISNNFQRLYQLTPSCTVSGFQPDNVILRACDAFGRCAAATPDHYKIYFVSYTPAEGLESHNRIERADLFDGSHREVLLAELDQVTGLDLDLLGGYLYWIEVDRDTNLGRIRRASLDGLNPEDLLTGLPFPAQYRSGSLVLNPQGGKIYWSQGGAVGWANLDGSGAAILHNLAGQHVASELAVDLQHGKLYWIDVKTDLSYDSQIWRADLDGTDAESIVTSASNHLFELTDLALDLAGDRLYWVDDGRLWRAALDGTGATDLQLNVWDEKRVGSLLVNPTGTRTYFTHQGHIQQYDLVSAERSTLIEALWDKLPWWHTTTWSWWHAGPMVTGLIPGETITHADMALGKVARRSDGRQTRIAVRGETFDYELVVSNQGPLNANDVILHDTLPAGVTFVSAAPASAHCSAAGGEVTCALGTVPWQDQVTVTLQVQVEGSATGLLVNTAHVEASQDDPDLSNNSVSLGDVLVVSPPGSPPAGDPYLYWRSSFYIERFPLADPTISQQVIPDTRNWERENLAVDDTMGTSGGKLYWVNRAAGLIRRANLDGTDVETVISGLTNPNYVAVAPLSGYLFWVGNSPSCDTSTIERANLDGTGRQVLFSGLGFAGPLAVDELFGKLYWTDQRRGIRRANLDGSGEQVVIPDVFVVALSVDSYGEKIYWTTGSEIRRANLDGSGVQTLHSGSRANSIESLALHLSEGKIYWSENDRLRRANLDGSAVETLATGLPLIWHLALGYSGALPPTPTPTPSNTPTPSSTPTATPTPTNTPTPTTTPQPVIDPTPGGPPPAEVLNWSGWYSGAHILESPLYCYNAASCIQILPPGVTDPPRDLAVDSAAGKLYWIQADLTPAEIRRANLDGSNVETIVTVSTSMPNALALDPQGGHIYWTLDDGRLRRAGLDGANPATLLAGLGRPTWLALDPVNARLYWLDEANTPLMRIQRANLDGTGLETVLEEDGSHTPPFIGPETYGLAVDYVHNWLFWVDRWYYLGTYPQSRIQRLILDCTPADTCLRSMISTPEHFLRGIALDLNNYQMFWGQEDQAGTEYTVLQQKLDGTGPTYFAIAQSIPADGIRDLELQYPSPTPTPTDTATPTNTPTPSSTPTPSNTPTATTTPQALPTPTPGGPPAADQIFWGIDGEIQGAPIAGCLDGSCINTVTQLLYSPADLQVDSLHGKVYWFEADVPVPAIKQANLDGTDVVTVITNTFGFGGIELDPENDRLYWSEPLGDTNGRIMAAHLDGSDPNVLLGGLDEPTFLSLDTTRRLLYWLDGSYGYPKMLLRADLSSPPYPVAVLFTEDGSHTPPHIGEWVWGLAVDTDHQYLFWPDSGGSWPDGYSRVQRADLACLEAGNPVDDCLRTMVEENTDNGIRGLALDRTSLLIYWGNLTGTDSIRATLLDDTGPDNDVIAPLVSNPQCVALVFPSPTPTSTSTPTPTDTSTPTPTCTPLVVPTDTGTPTPSATPTDTSTPTPTWTPTPGPGCVPDPDPHEADDAYRQATGLALHNPSLAHNFHVVGDEDWLYFDAEPGHYYEIHAAILGGDADTFVELYASDGTTLLADNGNPGGQPENTIHFAPNDYERYYLRVTNLSGLATCDTGYNLYLDSVPGPPLPGPTPMPPGHLAPALDSAVVHPADGSVVGSLGPVQVDVGAHAADSLQTLTVTLDGGTLATTGWPSGAVTDTTWTTAWTALAEGVYTLDSVASDWTGRVQTETHPIHVIVDTGAPTVSIAPAVYTTTHLIGPQQVALTGAAHDTLGVAQVWVSTDGAPWQSAQVTPGSWTYPWPVGLADGLVVPVSARAVDPAGRTAQADEPVTVDIVPPAPVDIFPTHLSGGDRLPIAPEQTVYEAYATLVVTWTASSDGSGLRGYYVGWTQAYTPALSALTFYAPGATREHSHVAGEAEALYFHVVSVDVWGNRRWQTSGPYYVDGPATPDLVAFRPAPVSHSGVYHGWMYSGATQLAADREIHQSSYALSPFGGVQRFYMTWDDQALRLAWTGADWDYAGDLYVYLDVAPGGAPLLYNPYLGPASLGLPAGFAPDLAIQVEDSATAHLLAWSGAWTPAGDLPADYFRLDAGAPIITDLYLPFAYLGIGPATPLGVLAVASEEDALRLWAAAPDHNPLNSERVVNPLALGRDLTAYDLTLFHHWPDLGLGVEVNDGRFADSDLALTIRPVGDGVAVGYLETDLLDLLQPGQRLDADGDGVVDADLPLNVHAFPLGSGRTVSYTIAYANHGPETAPDVVVDLTAFDALSFGGSGTLAVNLGDVGPGVSGTVTITADVNAAGGPAAELDATLADGPHGAYEWAWLHNRVDADPPQVEIVYPDRYVRPGRQVVYGLSRDESGVPLVELRARSLPGGAETLITCPDATPEDGLWSCAWDAGDLSGLSGYELCARGTDSLGNVGGWMGCVSLVVDDTPPTVVLDASFYAALADGWMTADEARIRGQVLDDQLARELQACSLRDGRLVCSNRNVIPGTAPVGDWSLLMATDQLDGAWRTLEFTGVDGVGNRSLPVTETFRVDVVPPVVTVTHEISQVLLSGYYSGSVTGAPVLSGTITDGGGVAVLYARVEAPGGDVLWQTAVVSDTTWAYTPTLTGHGHHILRLEAYDLAGNVSTWGPFNLWVDQAADLRVRKTDSADPIAAGDPLTYTLVVTNAGPSDAADVVVTDTLPAGLVLLGATASQGAGCSGDPVVVCDLGVLSATLFATVELRVDVDPGLIGTLVNTATVRAGITDPITVNNTVTETTHLAQIVDLTIAKSAAPSLAMPGEWLTFTLAFSNTGAYTATGVLISDVIPADRLTTPSYTSSGALVTPTGDVSFTWQVEDLAPGEGGVITLTGRLTTCLPVGDILTNTATITSPLEEIEPADNHDSAGVTVADAPPLAVDDSYATVRDTTLSVTAPLGVLANDVELNCQPLTATLLSAPLSGTLVLSPDGAFVYTPALHFYGLDAFAYLVSDGALTNTAQASIAVFTGTALADLAVTKTASEEPIIAGADLGYSLVVTNNGPFAAVGVAVYDRLPPGTAFRTASPGCGEAGGVVSCTLGMLAAGGQASFDITVTVGLTATGPLTNTAVVTSTAADPDLANNTASVATGVVDQICVYIRDFETAVGDEWSNPLLSTTPSGRGFLGEFGNGTVSLSLSDLPAHTHATLRFNLYVIRSWDGNQVETQPGLEQILAVAPQTIIGPDVWGVHVSTGETLLRTTFSNWEALGFRQAFPGQYPGGDFPARTGAVENQSLGYDFQGIPQDAVYRLFLTFDHEGETLELDFEAAGLQQIEDESWGLDNLELCLDGGLRRPKTFYLPIIMKTVSALWPKQLCPVTRLLHPNRRLPA